MTSPFKLFHFDIATENNFGDTLLFPAVKHVFEAYGGGEAFDVYDSRPLRENVGPALVRYINRTADAVVLGGGGLFLSDTNPNRESGWQWRISLDMLDQLEVPLIVFAVGYNRFYGQPDFEPPFAEHVSRTIEKSIFFGLRNHGSIDRVSTYVPEELSSRITFQPCPTTLSRAILPIRDEQPEDKRIGIQLSTSRRCGGHGVGPDTVLNAARTVIPLLEEAGWDIVFTPFTEPDHRLSARLGDQFKKHEVIRAYGEDVLTRGIRELSTVPFLLGCRGHAQMIPFGLGAMPFSMDVHPKLGYFLSDIGRPEWRVDPADTDFGPTMVAAIEDTWEYKEENRAHLASRQSDFLDVTVANLDTIFERLGGDQSSLVQKWKPYGDQEWNMARGRFLLEVQRENSIHRQQTLREEMTATETELKTVSRDNHTAAEDRRILESRVVREQLRAEELLTTVQRLESQNQTLRTQLETQTPESMRERVRRIRRKARATPGSAVKRGKIES